MERVQTKAVSWVEAVGDILRPRNKRARAEEFANGQAGNAARELVSRVDAEVEEAGFPLMRTFASRSIPAGGNSVLAPAAGATSIPDSGARDGSEAARPATEFHIMNSSKPISAAEVTWEGQRSSRLQDDTCCEDSLAARRAWAARES